MEITKNSRKKCNGCYENASGTALYYKNKKKLIKKVLALKDNLSSSDNCSAKTKVSEWERIINEQKRDFEHTHTYL